MRKRTIKKLTALLLVLLLAIASQPLTAFAAQLQQTDADGFYVNMPASGSDTLDLSDKTNGFTFKVYDDGGSDANYSDSCDGYLQINAPDDYILQLSGSVRSEDGYDNLYAYDGNTSTALGQGSWTGGTDPDGLDIGVLQTRTNVLILRFNSDDRKNNWGLDLTVTVTDPSTLATLSFNAGEGSGTMDSITVAAGTEVTVPESGFYAPSGKQFAGYSDGTNTYQPGNKITLNENKTLTATYLASYTVTYSYDGTTHTDTYAEGTQITLPAFTSLFTLPEGYSFKGWQSGSTTYDEEASYTVSENTAFTALVEQEATLLQDDDGNWYTKVPVSGTVSLDLTDKTDGYTLKVYDDGGADSNYSNYCSGYLRIVAPENCLLSFSGSGSAESNCDYLRLYDGDTNNVIGQNKYDYNFTINTHYTTGNVLRVYFYSDYSATRGGFDLTVTLCDLSSFASLYFEPGEGSGTMNRISVLPGENVTVPACGFTIPENKLFSHYTDGENEYHPNDVITLDENKTLTAVYGDKAVVTYAYGDNTQTVDVADGSEISLPAFTSMFTLPERQQFKGWQCGETLYAAGDPFTVTGNVTFTAVIEEEPVIMHGEEGTTYANYENYTILPKSTSVTADLSGESEDYILWIFDNGGVNGNYANGCNGSVTVIAPEGCILQIAGDVNTEQGYDYLYVYDGDSSDAESLGAFSGNPNTGKMYSTGNVATIRFTSDSSTNRRGVDVKVRITRPEALVTISFDPGEGSGTMDDIVMLPGDRFYIPNCGFTLPEKTFFDYYTDGTNRYRANDAVTATEDMHLTAVYIEKILITYQSGTETSVVEYRKGNTVTLSSYNIRFDKLPYRKAFTAWRSEADGEAYPAGTQFTAAVDSTFTAVFEDLPYLIEDGSGGYYALMPENEDVTLDLSDKPNGFSFKLYDNGGANGYYSDNCDGSMTITAPENCVLQVSGSIKTEGGRDCLYLYDSDLTTPLGKESYSADSQTAIPELYSDGRNMKICFRSDGSYYTSGFELTVTVLDPSTLITISFDAGEGSGEMEPLTQLAGVPFKLPDYSFTAPEGKIFSGYSDGTNVYWPVTVTFNESKTLTALWEEATGITYSCNGEDKAIRYVKGSTVTLPELSDLFTPPSGMHFVGWTEKFSGDLYQPGDPFVLNSPTVFTAVLEILQSDGNGGWYATMPVNNINSDFVLDLSDKPNGFSFTLYDDGGSDGNYVDYNDGKITVKAPENMTVTVSGSGQTESGWDYMYFYNGATTRSSIIGNKKYTGNFTINPAYPVQTDGNYLTIYFHSDSSNNYSGFALTVTVLAQNQITYEFDGETQSVAVQKDSTIQLEHFDDLFASNTKEFLYWQLGDDTYNEGDEYYVSEDVTFTAVTRLKPTVTLEGSGATVKAELGGDGTITTLGPIPYPTGTTDSLPHAAYIFNYPENKYFGGWSYNGTTYNVGDKFTITEDVTFTAIWRDASAWDLLNEQLQTATGTITLTEDVTAAIGSLPLNVPEGVTVTIDLNGHTLNGTNAAAFDGSIINVYGDLTITDSGETGAVTGGSVTSYENGAFTPDSTVAESFAATVTQSYRADDENSNHEDFIYSVSWYPTIAGTMKAAEATPYYADSLTLPEGWTFRWYLTPRVTLLQDVTVAEGETLTVNSFEGIDLDLNGHSFDVCGTFNGGIRGWRYEDGEIIQVIYHTSICIDSTTPGVFRSSGTIDVNLQPWTADTYYFTGGTVGGVLGADGGIFHISGGHFTDLVMFNNGNDEASPEIDLSGDAEFDRLEHIIYSGEESSAIHMTINDNVRVGTMVFEIMGDDVVNYPVLTINGGYFTVDPTTFLDTAGAGENAVQIMATPEQYDNQADWAADSDTYTWRVKSTQYQLGDVNRDGKVTISDVTAIQRHLAEIEPLTDEQLALADTDGDGEVTIDDATLIQMYLAEYDVTFG